MKKQLSMLLGLLVLGPVQAETLVLDLAQITERALSGDQRITEKEKLTDAARALLQEAEGAEDWVFDLNTLVGVAPKINGGITMSGGEVIVPENALDLEGLSPWYYMELTAIKPLYTFGKVESYARAAQGNIQIKQADVALQRGEIMLQAARAYHGYLAARDTRAMLEDSRQKMQSAEQLVQGWLENGEGNAKQSDLYALQTGVALLQRYIAEANGYERVAMAGLRLLAGMGPADQLQVADERLQPVALPDSGLAALQDKALTERPEVQQLNAGLEARRAWMMAKRSESYPNVYAGVIGTISYSPLRDSVADINVYDPFNASGVTPVVGLKWDWSSGRQPAQVARARAELESTLALKSFAQKGIPFEVEEQYNNVHTHYEMVQNLYEASRSSRRWMIATYADFEAGVEQADKIISAMLAYIQAYGEYLKKVNDYNLHVARLQVVTGEIQ